MLLEKVLYRAQVRATGGRDARVVSPDGILDLKLTTSRDMGGSNGRGTNPEQLFAASYAGCFLRMLKFAALRGGIVLPVGTAVEAIVGIGPASEGFAIEVELKISLPGLHREAADALVEIADATCPYSGATRGNISVRLVLA